MPNNKKNEAQREARPKPPTRGGKRTPSAGADKTGSAVGDQSASAGRKGAAGESAGLRRSDK